METYLSMSTKELSRLEVMQRLSKKHMNQKEAGEILHLCTRQIKRLLKSYKKQGAVGLISKHRGRKAANLHSVRLLYLYKERKSSIRCFYS